LKEKAIIKTNLFNFLPVIVIPVVVVCVCIFTACKDKDEETDSYAAPSGFDKGKEWLGKLKEESYSSATTGAARKCYVYTPPGYYTIHGGHDFGVWKNGLYNFIKRIF
jgi:hypothetical protein